MGEKDFRELLSCTIVLVVIILGMSTILVCSNKQIKEKKLDTPVKCTQTIPSSYKGEYVVTYYTHTGYNTSTGVYPKSKRTVAVDPKVIPYGTFLYIEGVGYGIAEDTGKDIKGNRLDVFVDSREQAISLGRKKAKVYVLEEKKEN